jgi:cell wall-associated NlpC family hydrolase
VIGHLAAATAATVTSFGVLVVGGLSGFPAPSTPSKAAAAKVPVKYLGLYQRAAATCEGLDWTILAAVGAVESDHGQSELPGVQSGTNSAGAQGPMQFLPGTFAAYSRPVPANPAPTEPGGSTPPSPYDPVDAIYAAARYLCASGVADDVTAALVTYNCGNPGQRCQLAAAPYSAEVLATAASYRALDDQAGATGELATQAALSMLGTPYVWGGEDPTGFDCSGLAQWAYAHAGVALPRTAQLQYNAGPLRPPGAALQTGDLVFFGTAVTAISHLGIYVGNGIIVDAPHTGAVVRLAPIASFSLPYIGATAPGNAA